LKNCFAPLSESDFNFLNALADGELSQAESEHWKHRISTDDHAAAVYKNIVELKIKLSACSNIETVEPAGPELKSRFLRTSARTRWVLAASIAAVVLVGGFWQALYVRSDTVPVSVLAWHKQFSTKEYVVNQTTGPLFVSLGQFADIPVPDLKPSKLYLVDTKVIDHTPLRKQAVLHYRGLRGCRLTIWTGIDQQELEPQGVENFRQWLVGETRFGIIATGMDKARFASIATHVETVTRLFKRSAEDTRTAMGDAYQRAEKCTRV
jgi:hypothetical protein